MAQDPLRRSPPPPPPPPNPFLIDCQFCRGYAEPLFCGVGRTLIYGADEPECARFEQEAAAFDELIRGWTTVVVTNETAQSMPSLTGYALGTTVEVNAGCRDALEVFFCAQQDVYQDDGHASACNEYRRPNMHGGRCQNFCPPIRDACPDEAYRLCETRCRAAAYTGGFCPVLEVYGLDAARWDDDTLDIMNLYRLEAEGSVPLLRDQRPYYRSIPARRAAGSSRQTKIDYYLYATRTRGYTEWLIDTNDNDYDGATAVVSSADIAPYDINSEWNVWVRQEGEWSTARLRMRCRDDGGRGGATSAAAPGTRWRRGAAAYLGGALATAVALLQVVGGRGAPRER